MSSPADLSRDFPFIPRLLHFTHAPSIIILTLTGIFIRFPVWEMARVPMRVIHYVFMTIVVVNYLTRIGWAFLGQKKDYTDFKPGKKDLQVMPKALLYYAFLKPDYPHLQKFNPLQKMTYLLFALVMPLQAYSGFCLVWPILATPISGLFGGVAGAVAYMRWVHWCGMLFYAMFTGIHVYLAATENFYALEYIFFIPLSGKAKELEEKGRKQQDEGHEESGQPAPGTAH